MASGKDSSEAGFISANPLEVRDESAYYANIISRPAAFEPVMDDIAALEVASMNAPEGVIFPEQKTYFCSLAWCEAGSFTAAGRGWSFEVKAGEVGVLDTGMYLSATAGKEGARGYYLLMDGPKCDQLLSKAKLWQGAFGFSKLPKEWLNMLAVSITQEVRQAMASHTGYQIFMLAGQQARECSHHPKLWAACHYIQQNWSDEHLNVESILAHTDTSRSKLSALFKYNLGLSILQYLNAIRLQRAQQMLLDKGKTVAEIAVACGLRDHSHFSSWFRKQAGKTPTQYRKGN